jgi:Flp pilus assembly protein TadD
MKYFFVISKIITSIFLFGLTVSFIAIASPPDTTDIKVEEKSKDLETTQEEKSQSPYEQGVEAMRQGAYQDAAVYLEEALEQHPDHAGVMTNLARVLIELDDVERASDLADRAIELDPAHADAYMIRGRVLHLRGEAEEATAAYMQCIEVGGPNPFALNNLGLIYIQQEQFEEAIPVLREAIEQRDDIAYFHNNLGVAYEKTGDYEAAFHAYQRAVDIDPGYDRAAANLDRIRDKVEDTSVIGTLE